MKCPECDGKTIVTQTRENEYNNQARRRECVICGYRFKTIEFVKDEEGKDEHHGEF